LHPLYESEENDSNQRNPSYLGEEEDDFLALSEEEKRKKEEVQNGDGA